MCLQENVAIRKSEPMDVVYLDDKFGSDPTHFIVRKVQENQIRRQIPELIWNANCNSRIGL